MTAPLSRIIRDAALALGRASSEDRREGIPLLIQGIADSTLEERGTDIAALTMNDMSRIALETADRVTGYEEG